MTLKSTVIYFKKFLNHFESNNKSKMNSFDNKNKMSSSFSPNLGEVHFKNSKFTKNYLTLHVLCTSDLSVELETKHLD